MKTIYLAALVGGLLCAVLAAIVGADFNSGLAPAGEKQQHAIAGAALWAVPGFGIGVVLGAIVGWFISARQRLRPASARSRRH